MRRGGQHNQRVGTGGKSFGELGTLCATAVDGTVGDILGLIDHDNVPIRGIECRAYWMSRFNVSMEMITLS